MNSPASNMTFADYDIQHALVASLFSSQCDNEPYSHWLLQNCLPPEIAAAFYVLPFQPAEIADTKGRRETHNNSRIHFGELNRAQHPMMDRLAHVFQDQATVNAFEMLTGVLLSGISLRIEYCQDTGNFWLEPHTDIGVKKFTMLIYLNPEPEAVDWGTDIYRDRHTHFGRAPGGYNCGLIFVPGKDTWHGFKVRPIIGVRKTIIINYVSAEWMNRHELCFPDRPVV
ncbi:MAG TPA: hypothetical protein VIE69_01310 [Methylophilaceae bacterium]|jgi:hypothetical protein